VPDPDRPAGLIPDAQRHRLPVHILGDGVVAVKRDLKYIEPDRVGAYTAQDGGAHLGVRPADARRLHLDANIPRLHARRIDVIQQVVGVDADVVDPTLLPEDRLSGRAGRPAVFVVREVVDKQDAQVLRGIGAKPHTDRRVDLCHAHKLLHPGLGVRGIGVIDDQRVRVDQLHFEHEGRAILHLIADVPVTYDLVAHGLKLDPARLPVLDEVEPIGSVDVVDLAVGLLPRTGDQGGEAHFIRRNRGRDVQAGAAARLVRRLDLVKPGDRPARRQHHTHHGDAQPPHVSPGWRPYASHTVPPHRDQRLCPADHYSLNRAAAIVSGQPGIVLADYITVPGRCYTLRSLSLCTNLKLRRGMAGAFLDTL